MNESIAGTAFQSSHPAPREGQSVPLPPEFIELIEFRAASLEHRLGYFGEEPYVIFGYCPGGGEVIWKDGHSSGFGTGGWRVFLDELEPAAGRCGVSIGTLFSVGTHVILMDRIDGRIYAAPRERAQDFLATVNHVPRPRRRCLCAMLNCATCPVHTCPLAGTSRGQVFAPAQRERTPACGTDGRRLNRGQ